jgi:23S rRNA (cytidine2498-2'-O)-methyltransferase
MRSTKSHLPAQAGFLVSACHDRGRREISMKPRIESEFVFSLCNPGSESALKHEVAELSKGWRSGYQRRGFVTFKSDRPVPIDALDLPIACSRRLCLSLGKGKTREEAVGLIKTALHPEPTPIIQHARFHERRMQGVHHEGGPVNPRTGDWIGTVVELGECEFWAGIHRHARLLSPDPAGDPGLEMPAESPSRAWLKLEEAIRFFDLEFTTMDIVVELGCAPGGVVLSLLQRGVPVIGVDPAKMADAVMKHAISERHEAPAGRPWFYHCRKPAALAAKRDLGSGVTWFMSDMNQAPDVVLKECARFRKMAPEIRGVLITLKLTDLMQVADKQRWLAALSGMGFQTTRLQQLSAHHKEFALLGML